VTRSSASGVSERPPLEQSQNAKVLGVTWGREVFLGLQDRRCTAHPPGDPQPDRQRGEVHARRLHRCAPGHRSDARGRLAVTVQVADTGVGIHKGDLERVLNEFQQVGVGSGNHRGARGLASRSRADSRASWAATSR
jgi:signal transduction histidine kinase